MFLYNLFGFKDIAICQISFKSAGGRVLNVPAEGKTVAQAVERAYAAIDEAIDWPGGFVRRDIAKQVLK